MRTGPEWGHIYDHFAVDFEYENGVHLFSMCRQQQGTAGSVSEALVGSKGTCQVNDYKITGPNAFDGGAIKRKELDPYQQEHTDFIASIRKGEPISELKLVTESTASAIMGREAAYTGKVVTFDDIVNSPVVDGAAERRSDRRVGRLRRCRCPARPRTEAVMSANTLHGAWAQGSDEIRVGLIGCGGRGTGAARNVVDAAPGVRIVAMADAFKDWLDESRTLLAGRLGDKFAVTDETCFVGLDAYQKLLQADVNYVVMAAPPAFRPAHIKAAVAAGKHIFAEKPVAVDGAGVRSCLESFEEMKKKGLGLVAGTIYRHHTGYLESIKRVHDGQIGDIVGLMGWYNTSGLWRKERQPSGASSSTRCATGCTTRGCPAIISSSRRSTTSTRSTGSCAPTRCGPSPPADARCAPRPSGATSTTTSRSTTSTRTASTSRCSRASRTTPTRRWPTR